MMKRSIKFRLGAIAVLLVVVTALIAFTGWDLQLSRHFYVPGSGFPTGNLQPWRSLYFYGEWPAFLLGGAALVVFASSFAVRSLLRHRIPALFLVLLLIIGPGIFANTIFKDHWGRPRPRQVMQFGGTMLFHQPWEPGPAPRNASFPAGHPTVAFYLSAVFFVLRKSRPRLAYCWLYGGMTYGVMMGIARIVQGGHFLSDVVWSAGFVFLPAIILAAILHPECPATIDN